MFGLKMELFIWKEQGGGLFYKVWLPSWLSIYYASFNCRFKGILILVCFLRKGSLCFGLPANSSGTLQRNTIKYKLYSYFFYCMNQSLGLKSVPSVCLPSSRNDSAALRSNPLHKNILCPRSIM